MIPYKTDCNYIVKSRFGPWSMILFNPYCDKLGKEIAPWACQGCRLYETKAVNRQTVTIKDMDRMEEELGLGTMVEPDISRITGATPDDYKGEDGEAIDAARRGK